MVLFQVGRQVRKILLHVLGVLWGLPDTLGFPSLSWMATYCYIYQSHSHYDQVANNELSLCIFEFCLAVVS